MLLDKTNYEEKCALYTPLGLQFLGTLIAGAGKEDVKTVPRTGFFYTPLSVQRRCLTLNGVPALGK